VTSLLYALLSAGATGQVTALASRAAAQANLHRQLGVDHLLGGLRVAGASAQAAELIERLPAAGMFGCSANKKATGKGSGSAVRPMDAPPSDGPGRTSAEWPRRVKTGAPSGREPGFRPAGARHRLSSPPPAGSR
jgi:hypothetical protein